MEGKNTKENVGKFINLLYMHLNEYIGFRTFNVNNVCGIYNVDPKVMDILVDKKALSRRIGTSKMSEYDWGSTPVTNALTEEVFNLLNEGKGVPEGKPEEVITKKERVMNRHNKPITQEDIDYVAKTFNSKRKAESIAKTIKRKVNSVYIIRKGLKDGTYKSELFKLDKLVGSVIKTTNLNRTWKKVTREDVEIIKNTMDLDPNEVAEKMGRTAAAVYSMRTKLRTGGFERMLATKKSETPDRKIEAKPDDLKEKVVSTQPRPSLLPPPDFKSLLESLYKLDQIKQEKENYERMKEKEYEAAKNDGSKYRRIRILWGLFTYDSQY